VAPGKTLAQIASTWGRELTTQYFESVTTKKKKKLYEMQIKNKRKYQQKFVHFNCERDIHEKMSNEHKFPEKYE